MNMRNDISIPVVPASGNEAEIRNSTDPERKITLFALHLALLEKTASLLSTICFVWATVVLLGGFAVTLELRDFWFVTIILLIEATRVFGRSHELQFQENPVHITLTVGPTGTTTSVSEGNPSLHHSDVRLLPFGGSLFASKNIRNFLYWIQVLSALACVALSLSRIAQHNFGTLDKPEHTTEYKTRKSALLIFYSLALVEGLIFLIERAYKEWKFISYKLIQTVSKDLNLELEKEVGEESIKRFFYRAYSKSVSGSILDSIKMDIGSFALVLLPSHSHEEQLIAVYLLKNLLGESTSITPHLKKREETLRKIATSNTAIERLIEMLTWENLAKEQIRCMAAEIVLILTGKRQNILRIARIPGAIESISSLLDMRYETNYDNSNQNKQEHRSLVLGLRIIEELANDHANAGMICNTRGLLKRIIYFTKGKREFLQKEGDSIGKEIILCSINVVRRLVGTGGHTGKKLRREISDNIFILTNLQKLLDHGKKHSDLQTAAIEILMYLALDEEATEKIGRTGGIIPRLLHMFTHETFSKDVREKAGDGLAFIAVESKDNCHRIIREPEVNKLLRLLEDPSLQLNSSKVLLSLCTYTDSEEDRKKLPAIISALPLVIKTIIISKEKAFETASTTDSKKVEHEKNLLEVSIGLAGQIIEHSNQEEYEKAVAETAEIELAKVLVEVIKKFRSAKVGVPRMRRFIVELSIAMMNKKEDNKRIFNTIKMDKELREVQRSTSELENFTIFYGTIGLSMHGVPLSTLLDDAIDLLKPRNHVTEAGPSTSAPL